MDSIFQIKINEHKLQKLLTELSKTQQNLSQQLLTTNQNLQNQSQTFSQKSQHFTTKFEQIQQKISQNYKQLHEEMLVHFHKLQNCIVSSSESSLYKIQKIDELIAVNSEEFNLHKSQFMEKLARLTEDVERKLSIKNVADKEKEKDGEGEEEEEGLDKKVEKLEKMMAKVLQATQLFQNKNFLYFLQSLVDKQQGSLRYMPQTPPQQKNPLNHQTSQQKAKRYNQIRQKLQQTHSKLQSMQTEYVTYFNSATQGNKQNRQQTHLHYALLSTKIKELEEKLGGVLIQNVCVEKILYPSQGRDRDREKDRDRERERGKVGGERKDGDGCGGCWKGKGREELRAVIKEEMDSFKATIDQNKSDLTTRFQNLQDEIWSIKTKRQNLKSLVLTLKSQLQKLPQKLKQSSLSQFYFPSSSSSSHQHPQFPTRIPLLHQFRTIQDDLQTKLSNKIDQSLYSSHLQQESEKFRIMSERIEEKANKEEIRKAFNFFQEKIREIVTILAGLQVGSRKTAGRKLMMQCLSCDQNFLEEVQLMNYGSRPITPKNMTSRINSTLKLRRSGDINDKNTKR